MKRLEKVSDLQLYVPVAKRDIKDLHHPGCEHARCIVLAVVSTLSRPQFDLQGGPVLNLPRQQEATALQPAPPPSIGAIVRSSSVRP